MTGAQYTMLLKEVIDTCPEGNIGLLSYPIFKEEHRAELNQKIIDHYWNREIAHESVSMFTFALRRKMNEIMPLYNKLYESELFKFDPLSTINLSTVSNNDTDQSSESKSDSDNDGTSTSDSSAVVSDTPQTMLSRNEDYATGGNVAHSSGKSTAKAKDVTTAKALAKQTGTSLMSGYQGVASDLLMRFRDSILNIDLMIINELPDLFMQIYGTSDNRLNSYTLERYSL